MNISEIGWQCWRKLFELSAKLIWSCWMWFPWGSPHFCLLKMQPVLRQTLSLSNQLVTCTSAFFCLLSRYVYWKWKMSMALTKAVMKAPATIRHDIYRQIYVIWPKQSIPSYTRGYTCTQCTQGWVADTVHWSKCWRRWCWGAWLSKHTKIHPQGKTNSRDDRLQTYKHYMHFWKLGKETLF